MPSCCPATSGAPCSAIASAILAIPGTQHFLAILPTLHRFRDSGDSVAILPTLGDSGDTAFQGLLERLLVTQHFKTFLFAFCCPMYQFRSSRRLDVAGTNPGSQQVA